MTPEQLVILKAAILASIDPAVIAARGGGGVGRNDTELARLYNLASSFIVWKTSVSVDDIGKAFDYTGVAALTSANNERLNVLRAYNPSTIDPRRADVRTFFADVFSVAAGATTRANLDALWRRAATGAEKLFATGTGTTLAPGDIGTFEGSVTIADIGTAMNT